MKTELFNITFKNYQNTTANWNNYCAYRHNMWNPGELQEINDIKISEDYLNDFMVKNGVDDKESIMQLMEINAGLMTLKMDKDGYDYKDKYIEDVEEATIKNDPITMAENFYKYGSTHKSVEPYNDYGTDGKAMVFIAINRIERKFGKGPNNKYEIGTYRKEIGSGRDLLEQMMNEK